MDEQPGVGIEIAQASYGKESVRVLTWTRSGRKDSARDVWLTVTVEGDFLASFRSGDNATILPSDTLRRHALVECERLPGAPVEDLIERVALRLLGANPAFEVVTVGALTRVWRRIGDHSFVLNAWQTSAEVRITDAGEHRCCAGVQGLEILTTAGSGFTGFLRDELTTQAESTDRPLCGSLDATWTYGAHKPAGDPAEVMAEQLLATISDRPSNAVQQLLTEVGNEILAANPVLATLTLAFRSSPIAPIPLDLQERSAGNAFEIGHGPAGITRVTLRRN